MGTRRSGKTSIQKVVFHKLLPHETLFLDSTNKIIAKNINTSSLISLQLLDCPGNFHFTAGPSIGGGERNEEKTNPKNMNNNVSSSIFFTRKSVLVYVIDAQDEETYHESIEYFIYVVKQAYHILKKRSIDIDILIHKTEDQYLADINKVNEIKRSIVDELNDTNLVHIRPDFHQTSIYNHGIYEAFSKIT